MAPHMAKCAVIAAGTMRGYMDGNPIGLEAVQAFGNRDSRRIDRPTALHLRNQASTFDLCLPLGAGEAMPAALTPAVLLRINDDGPMAGRPFSDMALHLSSPVLRSRAACGIA